jgi:hypothetical protein
MFDEKEALQMIHFGQDGAMLCVIPLLCNDREKEDGLLRSVRETRQRYPGYC